MKKIKKCYVLIFALILGLAPQAICWCFEPEFSAQITFPLFLFHNVKDIFLIESDITFNLSSVFGDQTVFRNNITLINCLVLPMVLSYSYILTATIVLGEYIYHIITKKNIEKIQKITNRIFKGIAILQFVNSVRFIWIFIFQMGLSKLWSSPSFWQWMWEIHLIQLIIAVLWQKNCEKSEENQTLCSLTEFRRQVVYLSCLSVTVTFFSCFTKIREYYYEEGMEEYYNLFFQDVLCPYSEQGVKVLAVLVIVIMLAAFYVITGKLQPKQQRYIMMITGKITNFVIILMTGWIMFFCIVEQFCQNQWYFIPDLFYVLVIGYGLRILLVVNHDQTGTLRII